MASEKALFTPVVELGANFDGVASPGRAERVVAGLVRAAYICSLRPDVALWYRDKFAVVIFMLFSACSAIWSEPLVPMLHRKVVGMLLG
jgi:hypothetical protein